MLVACILTGFSAQATAEEYRQQSKTGTATLRIELATPPEKEGPAEKEGIEIRLSDVLPLTISIEGPATLEVEKIDPLTRSEFWRVRETGTPETIQLGDGRIRWQQTFRIEPMNKGDWPLQIVPLRHRPESGKGDWQAAHWEPIKVKVMTAVVAVDLSQMRPITDPEALPEERPWWSGALRWGGIALIVLALCLGAWELKRRLVPPRPELAPHEWAVRELARLDAMGLPAHGQAERYHTLLSDTVRRYLELRFQLRAPRQTTTEFLEAMRQAPQLSTEQRTLLRDFLERCDLAKFARAEFSTPECQATSNMARTFVDQTRPVAEQSAAADALPAGSLTRGAIPPS